MVAGVAVTATDVMVGGTGTTVMAAEPNLVVSCVEVAIQVAVPIAVGVRTPAEVMVALVADQVMAELYAPVPTTCAAQNAVWPSDIVPAEELTMTKEIVGAGFPPPPPEAPPPQPSARERARRLKANRRSWVGLEGTGEGSCMSLPLRAEIFDWARRSACGCRDERIARG